MELTEIKKLFKIDLKQENRKLEYVYFKTLYIQQQREKDVSWLQIAKELNIKSHASCINLLKKLEQYKKSEHFHHIENAFKNKDKSSLDLYYKEYKQVRQEKLKVYKSLEFRKNTIARIKAQEVKPKEEVKKDSIWNVMINLRHKKTYLNDLVFNEWSKMDWIEYNKIINL